MTQAHPLRQPSIGALFLITALLTACAGPRLQVAADPSQPAVTLADAGVQITLAPNAWNGYPSSLSSYFTPIHVLIQNERSDEIDVRYPDFLLIDDAGNQFRVVPPAEVAQALFGARGGARPVAIAADWVGQTKARPVFYDPWWPYYRFPLHGPYYPFPYDPWYSPPAYPRALSYDVLRFALREGGVLPGARVDGFLYFQLATRPGTLLTFTWTPVTGAGQPLPTFRAQFRAAR
jgi:hypothetical protein